MIKTLVAHTLEIDDQEAAVSEILEQLDPNQLLKNSVGILVCHMDYITEGIVKALCEKLPFDVVGINTMLVGAGETADQLLLSVTVLTSDDVSFAVGLSEPLGKGKEDHIGELFTKTAAALPEKPAMTLVFAPMLMDLGGDAVLKQLDKTGGGIPIFGTLAIDFATELGDPRVIFNGETYNDRLGIILLSGKFEPAFSITSVPQSKDLTQQAIITESQANVILKMNDKTVGDYFNFIGLAKDGKISTASGAQIPLIVDYHDNADPVARSILFQNPEGALICGGDVPENSSVKFGTLDMTEMLNASAAAAAALAEKGEDGLLLFSCAARNFALGLDSMAEIAAIQKELGAGRTYMFAYSGGEFCPVKSYDGKLKNRFHNATLISCSFK